MMIFMTKCINMPTSLNGTKRMYIVTARLHKRFDMIFSARRINMHISLNGKKHMHISIRVVLHMI
jgi:hypothetical protein